MNFYHLDQDGDHFQHPIGFPWVLFQYTLRWWELKRRCIVSRTPADPSHTRSHDNPMQSWSKPQQAQFCLLFQGVKIAGCIHRRRVGGMPCPSFTYMTGGSQIRNARNNSIFLAFFKSSSILCQLTSPPAAQKPSLGWDRSSSTPQDSLQVMGFSAAPELQEHPLDQTIHPPWLPWRYLFSQRM